MSTLRCDPGDLPKYLYRVHYPKSQTSKDPKDGLLARDTSTVYYRTRRGLSDFKAAVERHFTWSNRQPSPFISLFSDCNHAVSWGKREPWNGNRAWKSGPNKPLVLHEDWELITIDTGKLVELGTPIYRVSDLKQKLDVDIPGRAKQHEDGAYICLHRVPREAFAEALPGKANLSRTWVSLSSRVGNGKPSSSAGIGKSEPRDCNMSAQLRYMIELLNLEEMEPFDDSCLRPGAIVVHPGLSDSDASGCESFER